MEKQDVFVRVRSIDQCERLYTLLKSKGEKIYFLTEEGLRTGVDSDGDSQLSYPYIQISDDKEWVGHICQPDYKSEVSIEELSEIL